MSNKDVRMGHMAQDINHASLWLKCEGVTSLGHPHNMSPLWTSLVTFIKSSRVPDMNSPIHVAPDTAS